MGLTSLTFIMNLSGREWTGHCADPHHVAPVNVAQKKLQQEAGMLEHEHEQNLSINRLATILPGVSAVGCFVLLPRQASQVA